MNYRHIYHAGNFADIMKHLALCLVMDRLAQKETPLCAIDAHGGIGLYNLHSVQAQKTSEWESGVGQFSDGADLPNDFRLYFDLVEHDLARGYYPGSPMLLSRLLRPQDRLIANELHPEDANTLRDNLKGRNIRVEERDAYECLRASLPPLERRGLILIDPPFEEKDEFETLCRQMQEWKKRFASGTYLLWYPIKAHLPVAKLKEAARDLSLPRTWFYETLRHPAEQPESFNGSGLILFNAPYQVPERLSALFPFLQERLSLIDIRSGWLVADAS